MPEGFAVALNRFQNDDDLKATLARLQALAAQVTTAVFDVTDLAAHARQLAAIEQALGPLTTPVTNTVTGVMARATF